MSSYAFKKPETYRDTILGDVKLRDDDKGSWMSEHVKITADKGRIVVICKADESNRVIQFSTQKTVLGENEKWREKLELFRTKDNKAKVEVEVRVKDEEKLMKEFGDRIGEGKGRVKYKDVLMERMKNAPGIWTFEKAGRRITIEMSEVDKEIAVVESITTKSGERTDTKIFNMDNELLTFDSATRHGWTAKINVKKEEQQVGEFLSNPPVKQLRDAALEQSEIYKIIIRDRTKLRE